MQSEGYACLDGVGETGGGGCVCVGDVEECKGVSNNKGTEVLGRQ